VGASARRKKQPIFPDPLGILRRHELQAYDYQVWQTIICNLCLGCCACAESTVFTQCDGQSPKCDRFGVFIQVPRHEALWLWLGETSTRNISSASSRTVFLIKLTQKSISLPLQRSPPNPPAGHSAEKPLSALGIDRIGHSGQNCARPTDTIRSPLTRLPNRGCDSSTTS
jgi:hypothetical protein